MADKPLTPIAQLTIEQLREEALYWRATAGCTLETQMSEAKALDRAGEDALADHIRVFHMRPLLGALVAAQTNDYADEHCEGCGKGRREGDATLHYEDGDAHLDCEDPAKADPLPEHAGRHREYWDEVVVARMYDQVLAYMAEHELVADEAEAG